MIRKAKVEILFPFFPPITPCMIPFPLSQPSSEKRDLWRGDSPEHSGHFYWNFFDAPQL